MADFNCTIVTPEGKSFEDKADYLSVPAAEGSLGVLSNHAPLITSLQKGVVIIRKSEKDQFFVIDEGVLEVSENNALMLTSHAVPAGSKEEAMGKLSELKKDK